MIEICIACKQQNPTFDVFDEGEIICSKCGAINSRETIDLAKFVSDANEIEFEEFDEGPGAA